MSKLFKFSGFIGLNNQSPEYGLDKEYLVKADNVIINDDMSVRVKKQDNVVRSGSAHSLWSFNDICLFREGDSVYRLYEDYTVESIVSGLIDKYPMSYEHIAGSVYMSDGVNGFKYSDGNVYKLGISVPQAPELEPINGSFDAGTYSVIITWVRKDKQESGTSIYDTITLSSGQGIRVNFPAPPSDENLRYVKVYMTGPDSGRFFEAGTFDITTPSAEFYTRPNTRLEPVTEGLRPLPLGTKLAFHNSRLYSVYYNIIYFSELYSYELYNPRTNFIIMEEAILDIYSVGPNLIVSTLKGIYKINQDRALSKIFTEPLFSGSGCLVDLQDLAFFENKIEGVGLLGITRSGFIVITDRGEVITLSENVFRFNDYYPDNTYCSSSNFKLYYYVSIK